MCSSDLAQMTDWSRSGGVHRFRDIIARTGLTEALQKAGAKEKSKVLIGEVDVSEYWY